MTPTDSDIGENRYEYPINGSKFCTDQGTIREHLQSTLLQAHWANLKDF
jgi:hypothetical protein